MVKDERDMLEALNQELDFIQQGGYGRSVKTPWKPTSAFQDSLTCLNYGYPYKAHPCSECLLIDFVPLKGLAEAVPCHHIPLNETGDTIESLEALDNQQKLETNVKAWLRTKIQELEETRVVQKTDQQATNDE